MKNSIFAVAAAMLLAACSSEENVNMAEGPANAGDSRIQVALGAGGGLEVSTTRTNALGGTGTETVVAGAFAGQEPSEQNPFHPMVWFSDTQGHYTASDVVDADHNMVNFTSMGLTFPDKDRLYNTANPNAKTYCFGLYPTNNEQPGLWNITNSTTGWNPAPQGSILYADISGQQDLMFAGEVYGSINDKFNSSHEGGKQLKFNHLLTWLKIRVNAAEEGAGEAWGDVKLVRVKTDRQVRVDLGAGGIYTATSGAPAIATEWVKAWVPDPDDPNPETRQAFKELEPIVPENPQIGSILVVPATEYDIEYQTTKMNDPVTIHGVKLVDRDGNALASADDARNNVFVITLSFYQRNKVEATCTLEPMTMENDLLYGSQATPLTLITSGGSFTYDGNAQNMTVTDVMDGGTPLDAANYDLKYSSNINAGTAVVTAVGKNTYAGRVGLHTYTIDKAAGTGSLAYDAGSVVKTYGDGDFTNPLNMSGLSGAGTLSYVMTYSNNGDAAVADVDGTGKVHINQAGTTTINAHIGDGANHTWSATPDVSYTLTVNKASGDFAYATTSISKTYDPLNLTFTNALTYTGDGATSYVSSASDVASVDATGLVTINKAGMTTITATVNDGTNYKYANSPSATTATYTVNIQKATGSLSFAQTEVSKTKDVDGDFRIPLEHVGDADVHYGSTNNAVATVIDNPGAANHGMVTLVNPGVTYITATVTDTDRYQYEPNTVNYMLTVKAQH